MALKSLHTTSTEATIRITVQMIRPISPQLKDLRAWTGLQEVSFSELRSPSSKDDGDMVR